MKGVSRKINKKKSIQVIGIFKGNMKEVDLVVAKIMNVPAIPC